MDEKSELPLTKEHTNDLIDRKIAEAKLDVALGWNKLIVILAGTAITIVGLVIPLVQFSSLKSDIEQRFAELSATVQPKPNVDVTINARSLSGMALEFTDSVQLARVRIYNKGSGSARNVLIRLYLDFEANELNMPSLMSENGSPGSWYLQENVDEPQYKSVFSLSVYEGLYIRPGDSYTLGLGSIQGMPKGVRNVLMKVLSEDFEPKSYEFTILDKAVR